MVLFLISLMFMGYVSCSGSMRREFFRFACTSSQLYMVSLDCDLYPDRAAHRHFKLQFLDPRFSLYTLIPHNVLTPCIFLFYDTNASITCYRTKLASVLSDESICDSSQLVSIQLRHFTNELPVLFCYILFVYRLPGRFKKWYL